MSSADDAVNDFWLLTERTGSLRYGTQRNPDDLPWGDLGVEML
jgi:hypothetical protein